MSSTSPEARSFMWLLDRFVSETSGVSRAVAVSPDGLLIGRAGGGEWADAERFAAIVSAVNSLASGASSLHELGETNKVLLDFEGGYLIVVAIATRSALGVLVDRPAPLGDVAYELAVFANQLGRVLDARLIDELKGLVAAH